MLNRSKMPLPLLVTGTWFLIGCSAAGRQSVDSRTDRATPESSAPAGETQTSHVTVTVSPQDKSPAVDPVQTTPVPTGLKFSEGDCATNPIIVSFSPTDRAETIAAAIKAAVPGTIFKFKEGVYTSSLNLSSVHGTLENPIIFVSSDGPYKARIVATPELPAISAWGISNVGIYGFDVVSNTTAGDMGGFKLGGPWVNPAKNVVIAGNRITGIGTDGIKFLNGATGSVIAGNLLAGDWREEVMDNVSHEKAIFAYNTTIGSAGWTSITLKGGSRDIEIVGNDFGVGGSNSPHSTPVVSIGGFGSFKNLKQPPYWASGFQASNVHAHDNRIAGSVVFAGGVDSFLEYNRIEKIVSQGNGGEFTLRDQPSRNNKIENNQNPRAEVGVQALPGDFLKLCPGRSIAPGSN